MQCSDSSICNENALCTQYRNSAPQCTCKSGFTGSGIGVNGCVAVASDPCDSIHCENGGTCESNEIAATCKCPPGTDPPFCNYVSTPCNFNFCLNGGTCMFYKLEGFVCECPEEFTGQRCEYQVQNCGGWRRRVNGTLKYPFYSNGTYEHNSRCEWGIKTFTTKVLNITFIRFDVEDNSDCKTDYLEVKIR